jgi:hypothetical protein
MACGRRPEDGQLEITKCGCRIRRVKNNGVLLRRYLLPDSGVHEAREVARIGGSDHDIVIRVLVQDGGLGGEDDVGVEGLV